MYLATAFGFPQRTILMGVAVATIATAGAVPSGSSFAQPPAFVEFIDAGKVRRGLRLLDVPSETLILGRDGAMHTLDPNQGQHSVRPISGQYTVLAVPELRNQLRQEYGKAFEVRATQNFLVVQPRQRGDQWPDLFEKSHRSFCQYMTQRGVRIRKGRFPMIAVVMPDETAMYRELKRMEISISRVAGVYSGKSNRVITHDGGRSSFVEETVRHEAAHQSAFNAGVHSRLTETPKWISEGIGQMFEPSGMTQRRGTQLAERANQESLRRIKTQFPEQHRNQFVRQFSQLMGDDTLFDDPRQVRTAYAISWAAMFYLAEREPDKFARLINRTALRPPFRPYPRDQRITDVEKTLGYDTFEFASRVAAFADSI